MDALVKANSGNVDSYGDDKWSESLKKKWGGVLDHPDLPKIDDPYKKAVTAVILENQEAALAEQRQTLTEAGPGNAASSIDRWDPVLISLVRRAMPNMMAYDVCGVQPMTGPTGLIFAMKSRYGAGATGNAAFGYWGGGSPSEKSTMDRLDYSSDTTACVAKGPLSAGRNPPDMPLLIVSVKTIPGAALNKSPRKKASAKNNISINLIIFEVK